MTRCPVNLTDRWPGPRSNRRCKLTFSQNTLLHKIEHHDGLRRGNASPQGAAKAERRKEVLQHLAGMLNETKLEKITTARIAEAMNISEGLLYRYIKSKADMFDALIDFAEESLLGLMGRIRSSEGLSGLEQVRTSG